MYGLKSHASRPEQMLDGTGGAPYNQLIQPTERPLVDNYNTSLRASRDGGR